MKVPGLLLFLLLLTILLIPVALALTTPYYVVNSTDAIGNAGEGSKYNFTTAATSGTTPPVISNVENTDPTNDSVTITWITDEDSDSVVRYGTTSGNYTNVESNTTLVTLHNIPLSGLSEETTYYYVVYSTDASDNAGEGSEYNFTTAATSGTPPPVIGNVENTDLTNDSVTITWITDEDSDSAIRYGTTSGNYTNEESDTTLVTLHNIPLSGLSAETTYYYVVYSTDAIGNTGEGSEYNFTTAAIPDTTAPVISNVTDFIVEGCVNYSNGNPVNDPKVTLTNLNTSEDFTANTTGNCYHLISTNISTGNVIRFNVTDDETYNITKHTVTMDDVSSGGIANCTFILVSTSPGIMEFSPNNSVVHEVVNATRTFTITLNQVVNVTWLINGTVVHSKNSTTDASYTNTSAIVGIWNVTAIAGNENGTATQTWNITSSGIPDNTVSFMIFGWVFYENGSECQDPVVNISASNSSSSWHAPAQTDPDHHYYQLVLNKTTSISAGDDICITAIRDGVLSISTKHEITATDIANGAVLVDLNKGSIDLVISGIDVSGYIYSGQDNTIKAVVENIGNAYTHGSDATLFVEGKPVDTTPVPSLGPGCNRTVNFNWMPDDNGAYNLTVTADCDEKINESNETNNDLSRTQTVGKPNILITGLNSTPSSTVNDGEPVTVTATINNTGNVGQNVTVDFSVGENMDGYDIQYKLFNSTTFYIEASGSNTTSVIWNATFGFYSDSYKIKADTCDDSKEINLTINKSRDFTVTNITSSHETVTHGENITLNVTLENLGFMAGNAVVDIYINNSRDREPIYFTTRTVSPGIKDYLVFDWNTGSKNIAGNSTIDVVVNSGRQSFEINDSNNKMVMNGSIFVNGTDLFLDDIIIQCPDNRSPYQGEIVNLSAIIINQGAIDAGNFSVEFYYNLSSVNHSLFNTTIDSLPAGDCIYVNSTWDLLDVINGNYYIHVRINHLNNPENNVTNNIDFKQKSVLIPWSVSFPGDAPTSIKEGENLTITAIVENKGIQGGNTSVKFYLDHSYLDPVLFNETEIYVDANSTKSIEVVWNARPLFSDPEGKLTTKRIIGVTAGDLKPVPYNINIETLDLAIEDIVIDPDYNVTITVKNNENRSIYPTFWFYDVNHTICDVNYTYQYNGSKLAEGSLTINHPDALGMSINFTTMDIKKQDNSPSPEVSVTDKNGITIYYKKFFRSTGITTDYPLYDWTNWSTGDTIYLTHIGVEGPIRSAALLEYKHLSMNASETKNFTVPWDIPIGEKHTIWVQLSNETLYKNVSMEIDLAVTDISANNETRDGHQTPITATIENIGYGNAGKFNVKFFIDDPDDPNSIFYSTNITNLDGNNLTTVTVNWTADTWNENQQKATLNHTIWVEIDCLNNFELENANNLESRPIQVNPTRDFSVTNLSFVQDMQTKQVAINTSISNFGKSGSTNVSIYAKKYGDSYPIYYDTHQIDNDCYVEVQWDASIAGDFVINATVDPDSRTLEINESNNSKVVPVYIEAPDLTVVNLTIDDPTLVEGDTVNITAGIANVGDRPVNANLTIYDHKRASEGPYSCNYVTKGDKTNKTIDKSNNNATAMRLYLICSTNEGYFRLYDSNDKFISLVPLDSNGTFNSWTEWIVGDKITVEYGSGESGTASLKIQKSDYLTIDDIVDDIIDTTLLPTNTTNVTVSWNIPTAGERNIVTIIDPEDDILELNEENNSKTNFLTVQGADLTISDLLLTTNGNEINGSIPSGTIVDINATITNIGVKPANNFNMSLVYDNMDGERRQITTYNITSLDPNNSINFFATWNETVGDYTIIAIVDLENIISETSDSNNMLSQDVVVQGADLNITNINVDIIPPDSADINDTSDQVYDTDTIVINATIENEGILQADNFTAYIFYEYEDLESIYRNYIWVTDGNEKSITKSYDGAECICIHISETYNLNDRLVIYNGTGMEIARPDGPGWIPVPGDTAIIEYPNEHYLGFTIDCYAGNITKFEKIYLDIGETLDISMTQYVKTGERPVRVFADPTNNVPGDPDENNYDNLMLHVLPSRDFVPEEINLVCNGLEIEVNDTIREGDTVVVDVGITMGINESDPYHEYRKATVDVDIIDEHEWIDVVPGYEVTSYGYAQVIRYPGADAIRVNFTKLNVSEYDVIEIKDVNGTLLCTLSNYTPSSPWLDRNEIYIYKVRKERNYNDPFIYIACEIDKYQYRKINRTTIEINATYEIKHISAQFSPDGGNHTIISIVDPDDKISEIIESNNQTNRTISVEPRRDPAVVDIMFSVEPPELPDPGDAVKITANVTNHGNMTTTFTVDLHAEKIEYRPYASLHPPEDNDPEKYYYINSENVITTYPEANWTGVHFTKISIRDPKGDTYLYVSDKDGNISEDHYGRNEEDLWTWVSGDLLNIKTYLFHNFHTSMWGFDIDNVAHIVTLNQTTVTLDPGETASVTGTLPNVRIGNRSDNYTIYARVDQYNTVFEKNESNNMESRELVIKCPDLEVDFDPPDKVVIINTGTGKAEDVEVRIWRDKKNERTMQNYMEFSPNDDNLDNGPDAVRVHFEELEITEEEEVWIFNETDDDHPSYTICQGNYPDMWIELEGKECTISCDENVDAKIDRYEYATDERVGDIDEKTEEEEVIPWTEYEAPYNLTIDADPGDDVIEINEDNNNKTISIYADVVPNVIDFSEPSQDKLIVDLESTIYVTVENKGNAIAGEFNVTLEIKDTNNTLIFNETKPISLYFMQEDKLEYKWKPIDSGNYTVYVTADSDGDVAELYEDNNIILTDFYVHPFSGYSGGGSLVNYEQGEVHGNVIFTIGDSKRLQSNSVYDTFKVTFDDAIPAKVKFARLYLYVDTGSDPGHKTALPIEVEMEFNNIGIESNREYTDISVGSGGWNVTYGLYCYDVTSLVNTEKENVAIVKRLSPKFGDYYYFGIAAIGLLVVTEDEDAVLTQYWINEGIDTIMAKNTQHNTGLPFNDCIVSAEFDNVTNLKDVNATLMGITSLVSDKKVNLSSEANGVGDVFMINDESIGSLMGGSHWVYQTPNKDNTNTIAMTDNKWEYVTKELRDGLNVAKFQSQGNYIVPTNAFLVLRYPPDLSVTDIDAPVSAVVGKNYLINTIICNEGKSNATDFNVTFYSNGVKFARQKVSRINSGETITLQFNWKPMYMGKIYKLKVEVEELAGPDWVEPDTDNNVMEKNVPIVAAGFGNASGPIGSGGEGIGGDGEGEGTSLTDIITGILMKGTVLGGKESGGGGGIGTFTLLGWIMKFIMLATGIVIICAGYLVEKWKYKSRMSRK